MLCIPNKAYVLRCHYVTDTSHQGVLNKLNRMFVALLYGPGLLGKNGLTLAHWTATLALLHLHLR